MIQSAYLRSYLPQEGRVRFAAYSAGPAPLRGNDYFLWTEPDGDDAFAATWQGRRFYCPRFPRLRRLEGMLAFNNAFPEAALIPETELTTASDELSQLRNQTPPAESHILTSPWHVPIRWFIAFLHEERELYERGDGLSIRYRTELGEAKKRVTRAVGIVADAGFDPSVVGQLESLDSWLSRFPDGAMLELDYAGVAELFSEGDLVLDESAADAAASLLALELGNYEESGSFYARLARRWGPVQSLAFAN